MASDIKIPPPPQQTQRFEQVGEIENEAVRSGVRLGRLVSIVTKTIPSFIPVVGNYYSIGRNIFGYQNTSTGFIEAAKSAISLVPIFGNIVDILDGVSGLIDGARLVSDVPMSESEAWLSIGCGMAGMAFDLGGFYGLRSQKKKKLLNWLEMIRYAQCTVLDLLFNLDKRILEKPGYFEKAITLLPEHWSDLKKSELYGVRDAIHAKITRERYDMLLKKFLKKNYDS